MSELDSAVCITSLRATAEALSGIHTPGTIDSPNSLITALAAKKLGGKLVDRVVIYNPDAVALWLYQKYTEMFCEALLASDLALPMRSVMPSVTPVCFASCTLTCFLRAQLPVFSLQFTRLFVTAAEEPGTLCPRSYIPAIILLFFFYSCRFFSDYI